MRNICRHLINNIVEHLLVVVIAVLLSGLFYGILSVSSSAIDPMKRAFDEFELSDLYYNVDWHMAVDTPQSADITLVDIGEMRNRADIAAVLQAVADCHPKVVGVDILFDGGHDDAEADSILSETANHMERTVFACKMLDPSAGEGGYGRLLKSYFAEDSVLKMGYVNTVGNIHMACVRKLSVERRCEGQALTSLAACVADAYKAGCLPDERGEDYLINYKKLSFPVVPDSAVKACADLLAGRIVLVGALSQEEDVQLTPIGRRSGLEVLAYSAQTLVNQSSIKNMGGVKTLALFLLVAYLTVLWQWAWVRGCNKRSKPFSFLPKPLSFFLGDSSTIINLLTLAWMAILAWASYLLYDLCDRYVPMVYLFAFIVLVCEARNLYGSLVKTLSEYGSGTRGGRFGNWISARAARSIYLPK